MHKVNIKAYQKYSYIPTYIYVCVFLMSFYRYTHKYNVLITHSLSLEI